MNGETIKSFLVSLGFDVDGASLDKFNKSIAQATLKVTALYASVNATATGVFLGISKISESFEQLGYEYKILAPAVNKALLLRQELLKAYSAAGVNLVKVVQSLVKFNISLTKTRYALEAIYKSVASRFFETLTKQSDVFRQRIYANMPKIQATLEKLVKFIFKSLEAVTELGTRLWSILTRVYDFFVLLDRETGGWSTKILAVIAAWKLLNLEFLATPLGLIIAGLVAILALFDDFKTYQEGGKSLFNWAPFIPVIDAVKDALLSVYGVLKGIGTVIGEVIAAFYQLFHGDFKNAFSSLTDAAKSLLEVLKNLWSAAGKVFGTVPSSIFTWLQGLFSNPNVASNISNAPQGTPSTPPLVGNTANSNQTNQHVQQQTNINVQGTADAGAVGRAVSGEQSKVNFDLVRNLQGATR